MRKNLILLICILLTFAPSSMSFFYLDSIYLFSIAWCAGRRPQNYFLIFIIIGLFKDIYFGYMLGYNIFCYAMFSIIYEILLKKFNHQSYISRWCLYNIIL